MWMQNVSLYKLNGHQFNKDVQTLQQQALKVTSYHANQINGKVTIKHHQQILMTTIPYAKGWHVKIDGAVVKPIKVINTFMAVPITRGTHHVSFTFIPPYLISGLIVSLLTLIACGGWAYYQRRRKI